MIGINEIGLYEIKIDFGKMETYITNNIVYTENDFNTAKIKAELVKHEEIIDLTDIKVAIKIITASGATMQHDVNILDAKNGLIEYTFSDNALYEGINYFQLILTKDKQIKVSPKLSYKILDVIDDSGVLLEPNYPILMQLVDEVEKLKENTNTFLETSKTNEDIRVKNEEIRVKQENDRQISIKNIQNTFNKTIKEVNDTKNKLVQDVDTKINEVNTSKINIETKVSTKINELDDKFKELQNQDVVSEIGKARGKYSKLNERLDNLDKDLLNIKDTAIIPITTESDFTTVEETINGYLTDVKVEGKTLVSITNGELPKQGSCDIESIIATTTQREMKVTRAGSCVLTRKGIFKRNTDYTVIVKVKYISDINDLAFSFHDAKTNSFTVGIKTIKKLNNVDYATYVIKLNTDNYKDIDSLAIGCHGSLPVNSILGVKDVLVLEGDYTQNPPSYFEGMKSVGDDVEEIAVSSVKADGNLLDFHRYITPSTSGTSSKWNLYFPKGLGRFYYKCILDDGSLVNTSNAEIILEDKQGNPVSKGIVSSSIGYRDVLNNRLDDVTTVRIYSNNSFANQVISNIIISDKPITDLTLQYKSDKKKVLYYDAETQTWKKPILREWDSIEEHSNGKYYYYKRTYLFDGKNEDLANLTYDESQSTEEIKCYYIQRDEIKRVTNCEDVVICDKLNTLSNYSKESVGISTYTAYESANPGKNWIYFKLPIEYDTVEKAKKFIKTLTIITLLSEEEVYECTPIDLITFENETNYMIECGAIIPKSSFKYESNIGNVINTLKEKVSYLEDKLYKTNLANFTVALNALDTKLKLEQLTNAPR